MAGVAGTKLLWSPTKQCITRYAVPYVFSHVEEPTERSPSTPHFIERETQTEPQPPWCCGCLQTLVESYTFGCRHEFCKRCIAETRQVLVNEFKVAAKDTRSTMKCPVADCHARIRILPLINGDFRFFQHRALPPAVLPDKPKRIIPSQSIWDQEHMMLSHFSNLHALFGCKYRKPMM